MLLLTMFLYFVVHSPRTESKEIGALGPKFPDCVIYCDYVYST